MVFSSVPVYLDPPNWNHHQDRDQATAVSFVDLIPEAQQMQANFAVSRPDSCLSGSSTVRPNSMAERARVAKLPQPEQGLKCPRCDSANTKFCYFNNYSLSQPRHFCKTCRRYWTRGGALRNVPVGGGCRRNKRSKSSSGASKSSAAAGTANSSVDRPATVSSSSSTATGGGNFIGAIQANIPQLPFAASVHSDYGLGLGFGAVNSMDVVELDQWRMTQQIQQFPFVGALEAPPQLQTLSGLYGFDGEGFLNGGQVVPKVSSANLITQMASVKMEDSNVGQGLSLPRHYLGLHSSEQFWSGSGGGTGSNGGWNNGSFNASASTNML